MRPCLFLFFYIFFLFSFYTLLLRDRHHERWEELRLEKGRLERTGLNLHPDILTAGVPRLGKAKFIVTQSLSVSGSLLLEQKLLFSLRFWSVFSSGSHWSRKTFSDGHNLEHGYSWHPEDEGQEHHSASPSTQDTRPCHSRNVCGSVLIGLRNPDSNKEGWGGVGGWRDAGRAQHLS